MPRILKTLILILALMGTQLDRSHAFPLSNQAVIDSTGAGLSFTATTTQLSIKFTSQQSAAVTQVHLRCHASLFAGSSPLFQAYLYSDSAGVPGSLISSSTTFNWTPNTWAVLSMAPAISLSSTTVYHILIKAVGGPGPDANNNRTLATSQPFHQIRPLDQTNDAGFLMLSSLNSGTSYIAQALTPAFLMEFDNGTFQGNPYYNLVQEAVHGGASPPSQAITDDFLSAESLDNTNASPLTVGSLGVYADRANVLAPTDDLFYTLYETGTSTVLATGPAAFSPLLGSTPGWFFVNFPGPMVLKASNNYRLQFFSPGSRMDRPPLVFGAATDAISPYGDASFRGSQAMAAASTNGGGLFTTDIGKDLDFQMMAASLTPTTTPSPVPPGVFYGNQAAITSNSNGMSIDNPLKRVSLRFTAQAGGNLAQVHVSTFVTGTPGNFTLELRSDDFGDPGLLLGTSNSFTPTAGFQAVPFGSLPAVSANVVYHLVFVPLGSPSVGNSLQPVGTLPFHRFISSNKVFDANVNYLSFNGLAWTTHNVEPVYLLEYQAGGSLEGNPYDSWSIVDIHGKASPIDHSDDSVGGETIAGSAPTQTYNTFEAFVFSTGSPGDLYYQLQRIDSGNEQILDSGLLLSASKYSGPGWYKVNLHSPLALSSSANYRFQLYCHSGDSSNRWYLLAPACSSGNASRQAASFGPSSATASSTSGQAGTFVVDGSSDMSFRMNQAGSVAAAAPTATITRTPSLTQTPTITPTLTFTASFTPTISFTPTNSFTLTPTPTATPTSTSTASPTPTDSPTSTPSSTPTLTPTNSPTSTPSATRTPTNSFTPTFTFSPTTTATFSLTPTASFTPTLTAVFTATDTSTPPATATPTPNDFLILGRNLFDPVQQSLTVDFRVIIAGNVKIAVYNIVGEQVVKLIDLNELPGNYQLTWNGRNKNGDLVGNGVYFVTIQQPSGYGLKQVIVLK